MILTNLNRTRSSHNIRQKREFFSVILHNFIDLFSCLFFITKINEEIPIQKRKKRNHQLANCLADNVQPSISLYQIICTCYLVKKEMEHENYSELHCILYVRWKTDGFYHNISLCLQWRPPCQHYHNDYVTPHALIIDPLMVALIIINTTNSYI